MRPILFFVLTAFLACSRSPTEPAGDPAATAHAPAAATPPSATPPHHPFPPMAGSAARPVSMPLRWDDPPRWKRRPVPSTPMRTVEWAIPHAAGDTEDGECFVITFGPGQGGSVDENVERWVKQLEPTTSGVDRSTRTVSGMNVTRVEVAGTYTPMQMPRMPQSPPRAGYRLVGYIVEAPTGLWFIKMTGQDATAKAGARELDGLIDSLRLAPDAG